MSKGTPYTDNIDFKVLSPLCNPNYVLKYCTGYANKQDPGVQGQAEQEQTFRQFCCLISEVGHNCVLIPDSDFSVEFSTYLEAVKPLLCALAVGWLSGW